MKIVLFDFVIHFGGGPQLAVDTTKRLTADNGVEVVDVYGTCKPYLKSLEDAGIKVHIMVPEARNVYIGYSSNKLRRLWRMICQIPVFLRLRKRLIRKILEINPDVLWTNTELGLLFLGFSFRLRHYPLAMEIVNCRDASSYRGAYKWLMKHRLLILMAISTETAKQLQLAGMKEDRIHIVFDTIDVADTINRSTQALEAPLPGLDRHPRIVVPARLVRAKGQHTAIKAIARLKSEGLEPTLWLAGDIVGNDRSYLEYLQSLAKGLEVSQNVHFLGWRYDVPAVMSRADIVVFPTHSEGFGHVVLEAMLLRRPIVATPVGGIKDSIEDGVNGLTFPVDDDAALARQIKRICTDGELTARLTDNGYKTVTERFAPDVHTKKVQDALARAIELKNQTRAWKAFLGSF